MSQSLRRQLLRPLLWIWLVGLSAAAIGAYLLAGASADAAFDRALQDQSTALAAKIVWTDRGPLLDMSRQALELVTWDSAERHAFVVLNDAGDVLAGDPGVPRPPWRHKSFASPQLFDADFRGVPVRGVIFSASSPMLDRSVSIILVETREQRQRLVRDVLVAMALPTLAIAVLTTSLLGWGIRRGLSPLREIAAEVARRAPSDLRALPTQAVPLEVQPLIERINTLLADVQQAVALQQRFVADAAHQLRTPAASLRLLVQELAQDLPPDPRSTPLVQALLSSSDRLNRLIGQLLSLVRTQGRAGLEREAAVMDLRPLLREAAEPLALRAAREGKLLQLEVPAHDLLARVHAVWLVEALTNVLDNALRYGGRTIVLRASVQGDEVKVAVEDDGPGVAADELPKLTEPFWRGARADTRADDGTGLGLAIAYEVVTRMGGRWEARTRPQFPGFSLSWTFSATRALPSA